MSVLPIDLVYVCGNEKTGFAGMDSPVSHTLICLAPMRRSYPGSSETQRGKGGHAWPLGASTSSSIMNQISQGSGNTKNLSLFES